MDKYLITTLFLLILIPPLWAQDTGNIVVEVNEISKPTQGPIYFMLFDTEEGFPREVNFARLVGKVEVDDDKALYRFENLPYGIYAVAIFQDENGNGEIDRNFVGFPKEPIGASNMYKLGKPSFEKSQIRLDRPEVFAKLKFLID